MADRRRPQSITDKRDSAPTFSRGVMHSQVQYLLPLGQVAPAREFQVDEGRLDGSDEHHVEGVAGQGTEQEGVEAEDRLILEEGEIRGDKRRAITMGAKLNFPFFLTKKMRISSKAARWIGISLVRPLALTLASPIQRSFLSPSG